jgi:hypothetical protein
MSRPRGCWGPYTFTWARAASLAVTGRDVREALVELGNDADKLPVGLRVNVAFLQ